MPRIQVDNQEPDVVAPTSPTPPPGDKNIPIDPQLQEKSGSGTLSAFCVNPANVSFANEQAGEEIILLLRAHLITNVPWILACALSLILSIVMIPVFSALGGLGLGPGAGFVFIIFWWSGTLTYAFLNFLYWYFNVYIVTDERVVDTDWYSVVVRKISSCQISKIQDASAIQVGALQGMFDFGDVKIETAAEEENFEFENVPHPQLVAKQLQELMQKEELEWEKRP